MNETGLGPEGVQCAYSSHRIRSLVSNGLFASSLPIQVEDTGNERGVRNRLAAAGQGHQSFASKPKQSELIVCQQFRNQLGSNETIRHEPSSLLEPQRYPMRLRCDHDLRMCAHNTTQQGRSRPRASYDEYAGVTHRLNSGSTFSTTGAGGSRANNSRILDASSSLSDRHCGKPRA